MREATTLNKNCEMSCTTLINSFMGGIILHILQCNRESLIELKIKLGIISI